MRTGVIILLVAFVAYARSKSVSEKDLVEKLLESLTEKRHIADKEKSLEEPKGKRFVPLPDVTPYPEKSRLGKTEGKRVSPPDVNPIADTAITCYMYEVGERVWMVDPCYECRYNSHCELTCNKVPDGQGQCREKQRKQCRHYGHYFPIGEPVAIPEMIADACATKFNEHCEIYYDNCNGPSPFFQ